MLASRVGKDYPSGFRYIRTCLPDGLPSRPRLQRDSSVDAVVSFGAIDALGGDGSAVERFAAEVARVLKPGAPFVFFERGAAAA